MHESVVRSPWLTCYGLQTTDYGQIGDCMATEVKLPELGENLPGGDVLEVKVREGDTVTQGQALLEEEAEKSTVEVPSPLAGRVSKLQVKKDDAIKDGQTLCQIEEPDGAPEGTPKA